MKQQFLVTITNGEEIGINHIRKPLKDLLDDYCEAITVEEIKEEEQCNPR